MKKLVTYLLLMLFIHTALDVASQSAILKSSRFGDNWYFNANLGLNQFYGDMSKESPYYKLETDTRLGIGFMLGKMIEPWVGVRFQFWYGQLKSTRRDILPLGQYYISQNIFEGNLSINVNFSNAFFGFKPGRTFEVYGMAGLGLTNWQSRRYERYTNNLIAENGYKGSGPFNMTTAFVFPIGAGFNIKLSDKLLLNIENSWHIVNSDIVDVKEGGSEYDIYTYTSLGLTYKFNWGKGSQTPQDDEPRSRRKRDRKERETQQDDNTPKLDDRFYKPDQDKVDDIPDPVLNKQEPDKEQTEIIQPTIIEKPAYTVEYRVQIRASYGKPLPMSYFDRYNIPLPINEEVSDGFYRYTIGSFDNLADADELKRITRNTYGVRDAFVVGYADGIRMKNLKYIDPASSGDESSVLDAEVPAIKYGIQIAASRNPLSKDKLGRQYNLNETIREDYIGGWYKYSVGAYDEYWRAQEYRNILLTRNNIRGCFVIAYKSNQRTSIPELFEENDNPPPQQNQQPQEYKPQDQNNIQQDGRLDSPANQATGNIVYRVQILSTDPGNTVSVPWLKDKYGIIQNIEVLREDGVVKYLVGYYDKYDDASMFKEMMIEMGLKQSFVVGYSDGKRIKL